jgi:hypothetical protein
MTPDGSREFRTSTDDPLQAISTQAPEPPLRLLLRQVRLESWLGRSGIQHPFVRRVPDVCGDPG